MDNASLRDLLSDLYEYVAADSSDQDSQELLDRIRVALGTGDQPSATYCEHGVLAVDHQAACWGCAGTLKASTDKPSADGQPPIAGPAFGVEP